jgi:hypothetical protein
MVVRAVSRETPAGHLARLKVTWPTWRITTLPAGYEATGPEGTVSAPDLPLLEAGMTKTADIRRRPPPRAADVLAERAMDVIDRAVAEGKLPG